VMPSAQTSMKGPMPEEEAVGGESGEREAEEGPGRRSSNNSSGDAHNNESL